MVSFRSVFLSQTFSVTLYSYGLAESMRILWPNLPLMPVTLVIVIATGLLAMAGADKALRAQVLLMGFVAVSLVALVIGAVLSSSDTTITIHPASGDIGFWVGFAVFFPAVTGVMPGLWAAIFSSAVGSVLAAPRTLQALARDGIAPRFLWRSPNDPKGLLPGMAVSMAIALGAVFLGNLNAVAAVVSMFFLTVYGTVNVVAAFEALSGDPSWRPRLRVPWALSLAGGLACVVVMILISPIAGVVALVAELGLWFHLSRREQAARWGDARRGLYEALIRWALVRLRERPLSARNWRPHILAFVDDPVKELDIIRFGDWFSQGRGVVSVVNLLVGKLMTDDLDLEKRREVLDRVIESEGIVVFPEVDVVDNVVEGIVQVMSIASSEIMKTHTESALNQLIPEIRIHADVRVILNPPDATVIDVIQRESANAAVVFLGLQSPAPGDEQAYAAKLGKLAGELPVVIFVKNSSMFIGELLEPVGSGDEGQDPSTIDDR